MAITTFIDPFGSMVKGYQEGQRTELDRQQGKRMMRDSDYEFQNRLVMDPLRQQYLKANVDQTLLSNLVTEKKHPLELEQLKEDVARRELENFISAATKQSKIAKENLMPQMAQAQIAAMNAGAAASQAGAERTRGFTEAERHELARRRFFMDPMMQNPDVGIRMLASTLLGYPGFTPDSALETARSFFPKNDVDQYESDIGNSSDPMYAQAYNKIADELAEATGVYAWEQMTPGQKSEMILKKMAEKYGDRNFNVRTDELGNAIVGNPATDPAPAPAMPGVTTTQPPAQQGPDARLGNFGL